MYSFEGDFDLSQPIVEFQADSNSFGSRPHRFLQQVVSSVSNGILSSTKWFQRSLCRNLLKFKENTGYGKVPIKQGIQYIKVEGLRCLNIIQHSCILKCMFC